MLIEIGSRKDAGQLRQDLEQACADHGFGVLGVHDITAKLREKGQPYDRACLVFEVCNPAAAREVLDANPRISTALPCRISMFETPSGATSLATIRPTLLLDLFDSPDLKEIAAEVERTIDAIMREAAGD